MSRERQSVVIIDDDASVRRALRRTFRSMGWDVETFATAEAFLERPPVPAPDCLVLDVHLPGLDGLELQERLQTAKYAVPVVFITAFADAQSCERALRAGAIAFLQKPFEEQSLLDAVGRALGNLPSDSLSG
jgi:FixJ family two-component response regulator